MTQVGIQYAGGLYALASEEGLTEQILQELKVLDDAFRQEPKFLRLLSAPNVPKQERCAVADESFRGRVHPYVLNFLKLLTEKGYARHFGDCCAAFEARYNEENGILKVSAVTAVPLTQQQTRRLTDKLTALTGRKIVLANRIDPACLGGVQLNYDGKRVDGTVKNRLDSVRDLLKNTVL